jgi:hypothetical protein
MGAAVNCGHEGCAKPTRTMYPGNDPENGPARPYCADGHSTCYNCGRWFACVRKTEGFTDDETGVVVPAGSVESDWCQSCEDVHALTHCGCGWEGTHRHVVEGPEPGEELSWQCCGDLMCCAGWER